VRVYAFTDETRAQPKRNGRAACRADRFFASRGIIKRLFTDEAGGVIWESE
jgi:hypothetical protein